MAWLLNYVGLFVAPGLQPTRLLSMGFSRQKYWSGLPFSFSGDLSDSGIEPSSPALQEDSLSNNPPGKPRILMLVNKW